MLIFGTCFGYYFNFTGRGVFFDFWGFLIVVFIFYEERVLKYESINREKEFVKKYSDFWFEV